MLGLLASLFDAFWDYHHDSAPALILGSFYPCLYYGFYCELQYKIGYLLLITLAGLGAWPGFDHTQRHHFFDSCGVLRFEPRIFKTDPPVCANSSFYRTGLVQHPARLSFVALSWTIHPFPRNGLLLASRRGRDVYHGCPAIVSLFRYSAC